MVAGAVQVWSRGVVVARDDVRAAAADEDRGIDAAPVLD